MRWMLIMLSTVLITLSSHADAVTVYDSDIVERVEQCEEVITKCVKALYQQKRYIGNLKLMNEVQDASMGILTTQIIEERRVNALWYRNPEYVVPLGIVVGVVLGVWIKK